MYNNLFVLNSLKTKRNNESFDENDELSVSNAKILIKNNIDILVIVHKLKDMENNQYLLEALDMILSRPADNPNLSDPMPSTSSASS